MPHLIKTSGVLFLLLIALPVSAYETRFEIDKSLNLNDLANSGQVQIKLNKTKGVYYTDASAVLNTDAETLLRLSTDYDHYKEMGFPNVEASRVVERVNDSHLYTWTHMSTSGVTSKYYLQVLISWGLNPAGAIGIQWEQARRKPNWPYEDKSAFSRFDGSWYLETISPGKVYLRYFVAADIDLPLPGFLIDGIVKKQLKDGVRDLIQLLARKASTKP
jgi:hypothetical protein